MNQHKQKRKKRNQKIRLPQIKNLNFNVNFNLDFIKNINKTQAIIGAAVLLVLVIVIAIASAGVKVSHKSPEGVVKSLVCAYQENSEKAVRKCFGYTKKETLDTSVENEFTSNMNNFKAHKAKDVTIRECKSLGTFNGYDLVYVYYEYNINLKDLKGSDEDSAKEESKEEKESNKLKAPAISLHFVQNKEEKYYVVPAKDINTEMSDISKREYTKFVESDVYKKYEEDYNEFIKEHPDYENLVSKNLKKIKDGSN